MPRVKTILQSDHPYSISARCINKEWFKLELSFVWQVFSEELYLTHKYYNLQIHSFVLMNNHYHLIASTPDSNISHCMQYFMKNVSIRLAEAGNRINETFAGRYYKTILNSYFYYLNAYKYIYRNPVSAKIVNRVEDYQFCTLPGLLGRSKLLIPVIEDELLFSDPESTITWLNQEPEKQKQVAVQSALRKQYFKSKKSRTDGKLILGEQELI